MQESGRHIPRWGRLGWLDGHDPSPRSFVASLARSRGAPYGSGSSTSASAAVVVSNPESSRDPTSGLASAVPELTGLLLSEETVAGLLDVIVNVAASAVDGVDGASVSRLISNGTRFETSNASSELIRDIDEAQYEEREGPCVETIRTGHETTFSVDDDQWPAFTARAAQAGVRSVWSLPLTVRDRTTGALNLYALAGDTWAETSQQVARELAAQAAIVLANAAALMSAELANENLRVAMETRDMIG